MSTTVPHCPPLPKLFGAPGGSLARGWPHSFLSLQCSNYLGSRSRILEERQLGALGHSPNTLLVTVSVSGPMLLVKIPTMGVRDPPGLLEPCCRLISSAGVWLLFITPDMDAGARASPSFLQPPRPPRWRRRGNARPLMSALPASRSSSHGNSCRQS